MSRRPVGAVRASGWPGRLRAGRGVSRTNRAAVRVRRVDRGGCHIFRDKIQPFRPPDLSIKEVFAELRHPVASGTYQWFAMKADHRGGRPDFGLQHRNRNRIRPTTRDFDLRADARRSASAVISRRRFARRRKATCSGHCLRTFAFLSQDPCDVPVHRQQPESSGQLCGRTGVPVGFVNTPARIRVDSVSCRAATRHWSKKKQKATRSAAVFTSQLLPRTRALRSTTTTLKSRP